MRATCLATGDSNITSGCRPRCRAYFKAVEARLSCRHSVIMPRQAFKFHVEAAAAQVHYAELQAPLCLCRFTWHAQTPQSFCDTPSGHLTSMARASLHGRHFTRSCRLQPHLPLDSGSTRFLRQQTRIPMAWSASGSSPALCRKLHSSAEVKMGGHCFRPAEHQHPAAAMPEELLSVTSPVSLLHPALGSCSAELIVS